MNGHGRGRERARQRGQCTDKVSQVRLAADQQNNERARARARLSARDVKLRVIVVCRQINNSDNECNVREQTHNAIESGCTRQTRQCLHTVHPETKRELKVRACS